MAENEELGMGMFENMDIPVELNLDDTPDVIREILDEEKKGDDIEEKDKSDVTIDDTEDNSKIKLNEDGNLNPEVVVGEEVQEEGDGQEASPNNYSSFAAVLKEQGLLPSLNLEDTKIEDVNTLVDVFKNELDTQTKNYIISKIGEDGYDALEKGITLSEYQNYTDNTQTLDKITEDSLTTDLELSKNIILQDYVGQGISETRALKLLKKTVDLGDEAIIEDAKESLESLKILQVKQFEQLQLEKERETAKQEAVQEKIDNDLKSAIYSSEEIIEGIKLDKVIQDKVFQSITKIVSKSPNGVMENKLMRDRRDNPIEFDTKLYYLYELTNGFNDFSKLISKSESKAVNKLEQALRQTNFKGQGEKPAFLADPQSYGGSEFGSELVI